MDDVQAEIAKIPYWYHKVELPCGIVTPGWSPINPTAYRVPDRLDGEVVLDVGAWDGYWTFEALKRGANHVLAIDDFSDTCGDDTNADRSEAWASFDLCAEALGYQINPMPFSMGSGISRVEMSVENSLRDDDPLELCFNRVFCFGVLYHLKNPLKALENCFKWIAPGGTIQVETAILDNITSVYTGEPANPSGCYAEFFPGAEFGRNKSNWWVPTLRCVGAWLQAVGFVDVEIWKLTDTPANLSECRGFAIGKKATA
jgi:tRNA (mo5U34)-methyltransferase